MRILITGATNGMGKGVARTLAKVPDIELVLLGRSEPLLRATVAELKGLSSAARIRTVCCDLSRMREVKAAVAELASIEALDAVFGYAPRHQRTEDGLDAHFQVNYLSQFMLTLHLLERLEASEHGGRVVFNTPSFGDLRWDDLQLERDWGYERAIGQAMVERRMFYTQLHALYATRDAKVSCFGFEIAKTVWTHQIELIPAPMRFMATLMKGLGQFISIDACGDVMAPLFVEDRAAGLAKSGRLIGFEKGAVVDREKHASVRDAEQRVRLWDLSLQLCDDEATRRAAQRLTGS
jgi:NAD(P)-dependent dehydrogenase (short-subunit alcohol dehydrogenase family)